MNRYFKCIEIFDCYENADKIYNKLLNLFIRYKYLMIQILNL
jgi:hypothetical protein